MRSCKFFPSQNHILNNVPLDRVLLFFNTSNTKRYDMKSINLRQFQLNCNFVFKIKLINKLFSLNGKIESLIMTENLPSSF